MTAAGFCLDVAGEEPVLQHGPCDPAPLRLRCVDHTPLASAFASTMGTTITINSATAIVAAIGSTGVGTAISAAILKTVFSIATATSAALLLLLFLLPLLLPFLLLAVLLLSMFCPYFPAAAAGAATANVAGDWIEAVHLSCKTWPHSASCSVFVLFPLLARADRPVLF